MHSYMQEDHIYRGKKNWGKKNFWITHTIHNTFPHRATNTRSRHTLPPLPLPTPHHLGLVQQTRGNLPRILPQQMHWNSNTAARPEPLDPHKAGSRTVARCHSSQSRYIPSASSLPSPWVSRNLKSFPPAKLSVRLAFFHFALW